MHSDNFILNFPLTHSEFKWFHKYWYFTSDVHVWTRYAVNTCTAELGFLSKVLNLQIHLHVLICQSRRVINYPIYLNLNPHTQTEISASANYTVSIIAVNKDPLVVCKSQNKTISPFFIVSTISYVPVTHNIANTFQASFHDSESSFLRDWFRNPHVEPEWQDNGHH